jgi:hypothetical protein
MWPIAEGRSDMQRDKREWVAAIRRLEEAHALMRGLAKAGSREARSISSEVCAARDQAVIAYRHHIRARRPDVSEQVFSGLANGTRLVRDILRSRRKAGRLA